MTPPMQGGMLAQRSLWLFRLLLLSALAGFSLNCEQGEGCSCLDQPPGPVVGDDDDSSDGTEVPPLPADLEEQLSALSPCEGGILSAFEAAEIEPPDAGSEGYLLPSGDTLAAISSSVGSLRDGEMQLAFGQVAVVGYELCRGEGIEEGVVLWRPITPGTGRALFALRLHAARPLQVEVPHPWQRPETLALGRRAFAALRARTLVTAGTHRCADSQPSGCAGDEACGGPPGVSDVAYSPDTLFQVANEVFSDAFADDLVVALEGQDEPGVVVSEGVLAAPQAGGAAEEVLRSLEQAGEGVRSCGDAAASASSCGIDNVQGLYINGVAAACGPAVPPAVVGRFVHLAQSADVAGTGESVLAALDASVGPIVQP